MYKILCIVGFMGLVCAFSAGTQEQGGEHAINNRGLLEKIGAYYEAEVPDTLDLAERAKLGINHLTSIISENYGYEMFWRADFCSSDQWAWPGFMWFQVSPLHACQPKAMEALAMERLMSGSTQNLEREAKMLEVLTSCLEEDGIYYVLPSGGKKDWLGTDDTLPRANVHGQGRMLRAMIAWYQYTGNPIWKQHIDRMVDGWDTHVVIHKEDYAYVPTGGWIETNDYCRSSYTPRGWKSTDEPANEKGGEEGSLFNHQGHLPGALANWYLLTGDKQALRLSGELVRYLTKPRFWADFPGGEYPGVVGAEHAHWTGHFHGHVNTLRAILDYAVAVNDFRLMAFVRDGYEWARQPWLSRIGIVGDGQGCGCGRLLGLAVKLSLTGVGDYWEDIDLYTRNQGSEMQIVPEDKPYIERLISDNPNPATPPEMIAPHATGTNVGVVEASIGAFSMQYAPFKTGWALCCSPHGNMGLFYAWDGTLRHEKGVVRINLLLNRASPWMDVDSYLPYEGKVVLRNKTAQEVCVRIPLWVDRNGVSCFQGEEELPENNWFGNYLRIRDLKPAQTITIRFPMVERTEHWAGHTIRFRGNTVLAIDPPIYPETILYANRVKKYNAAEAPMVNITRFVTPVVLKW